RLLGRAVTLPVAHAGFGGLPPITATGTVDELVARALRGRPEVARARAALADAQAGARAAQLDASLPDVTASALYGQLADAQGTPGKTVSGNLNLKAGVLGVQASLPTRDTSAIPSGLSLSLSATIPLLGSAAGTTLRQAQLGQTQAQLALDSASQGVELDVRSRYDALQDEQAALTGAQTTERQARTALDSARARVDAGLATALDLAQAELALQQATLALAAQQDAVGLAALQLALSTTDLDPLLLTSGGTP
ncbi:TolC family protein, partial [Deinococcus sp.]|uniref:TolC family protein n=1 Tax=Deinococcus sp. TaxID=47478 RepID=UPI002869C6DF